MVDEEDDESPERSNLWVFWPERWKMVCFWSFVTERKEENERGTLVASETELNRCNNPVQVPV